MVCLYPINLGKITPLALNKQDKKHMPRASLFSAKTGAGPISGFALEIGEKGQHANFNAFVRAVRKTRGLRVEADNPRSFTFEGTDGRVLGMTLQSGTDLPTIARDGVIRQWDNPDEWDLWRSIDDPSLIHLGWKEGQLKLNAGGHYFEGLFELRQHIGPEVERSLLEGKSDLSLSDYQIFLGFVIDAEWKSNCGGRLKYEDELRFLHLVHAPKGPCWTEDHSILVFN